jgi:hypothetical protein
MKAETAPHFFRLSAFALLDFAARILISFFASSRATPPFRNLAQALAAFVGSVLR